MGQKRTLTTRVPESQASEWDDYIENHPQDVNSMSHLLRKAVIAYIEQGGIQETNTTKQSPEPSGEVLNALDRLESKVDDVRDGIDAVERATYGGAGEWTEEVYEALPETESDAVGESTISKVTGAPVAVVIETLDGMIEDLSDVHHSEQQDGFYKEG